MFRQYELSAYGICRKLSIIHYPIMLLLLATSLTSCQKELCYDHSHGEGHQPLTVRFDWSSATDASPSEMSLMVFAGTSQPVRFQFAGKSGGALSLAAGNYRFIGFNSDMEMAWQGNTWNEFEIYSQTTTLNTFSRMFATTRNVPKTRSTEDQDVIYEPDALWTSATAGVEMSEQTYGQTVRMPMQEATYVYTFTVNDVDNLSHVSAVTATLSGMSKGWLPAAGMPSDNEAIIPFVMEKTADGGSTLKGAVRTFGHCPDHGVDDLYDHFLVLYCEMDNGARYYYTYDVSDAMHDDDHLIDGTGETEVPIVLEGLPLPNAITNGSGFQPDVTVWNEVNIGIDL